MTAAVQVTGLSIGYRARRRSRTTAVAVGLHATARRGELTVLLGPNGAGKSTLIRTLCGLQPALGGQVTLDGTDLTRLPADELARRVAVVLTDRVDTGLLTAREVVGLGRIPHLGVTARLRREDHAVIEWALAAVGAAHLADRTAVDLSDGERQRVLTARALAQQPDLLVLDEPTAFLDVVGRAGLFALLVRLAREQNLAVLLSTHDLELALRAADRVWLLSPAGELTDAAAGTLIADGRIGELFDSSTVRFDPTMGVFMFTTGQPTEVPTEQAAAMFAELSAVSSYFEVTTGDPGPGDWRPVRDLYTDDHLLTAAVDGVSERIGAPNLLVAASTFYLGLAARLWSLGVGALAGYGVLPDLAAQRLRYCESGGRLRLHLDTAAARHVDDPEPHLVDMLFSEHLTPLATALHRQVKISPKLLRGNTASTALGAGRAFDRHHGHAVPGPGWQLARRLCEDERLDGALRFTEDGTDYRRTSSCCLFYRTPGAGLCIDCMLPGKPGRPSHPERIREETP